MSEWTIEMEREYQRLSKERGGFPLPQPAREAAYMELRRQRYSMPPCEELRRMQIEEERGLRKKGDLS